MDTAVAFAVGLCWSVHVMNGFEVLSFHLHLEGDPVGSPLSDPSWHLTMRLHSDSATAPLSDSDTSAAASVSRSVDPKHKYPEREVRLRSV